MAIELHVDRTESLPIHAQLSEQIRYHIEVGAWEPGYRLPTVRFLAGSLGVNYNTVRAVYGDLEREGYVVTQQGSGTYVAPQPPKRPDQRHRVEALIDGVLFEADRLGVTAEQFARLSYLRAKMFRRGASHVPVLFLECSPAEAEFHAREILEATGIRPTTALVQDLAKMRPEYFDRFPVITTTLFHITEAQKVLGAGRRVHGLLVEPSPSEIVARLRPLARGSRVAIVCSTRRNARKIQNALQRVGLTHLRFSAVPIDSPSEVRNAFRQADEIVVSRRILAEYKGAWPSKRRLLEYVDVLPSASLRLLRREISEAALASTASAASARKARGGAIRNLKSSATSRRGGATGGDGFARIS
ncbi:MAG TPA: GntR family transcriptional regulator [Thermoanaerobaculia bacterium]|nr:GntR family transcriptional regulator [Thermoanaerobaculia bacterium]